MLLDKTLKIKLANKNIGHYNRLGYKNKSGEIVEINTMDMPTASKYKVRVECDNCHTENSISFHSFSRNFKDNIYLCKKCSHIRLEKTSLKKYNVKHPMQSKEIQEKTKQTNLERYGFEYPIQNFEVKMKRENTCMDKYGEKSYMNTDKFREDSIVTMLSRYGVSHPSQSEHIREKTESTCEKIYGVKTPLLSEDIKEKILLTKKLRYNDENYNNRIKYKSTCLELFGYENPMLDSTIKDKVKKTMMGRYGVEHPAQLEEIYNKMLKNGYIVHKYKDIYYQGGYELDFLKNYYHIGIKRGPTIKYAFNETEHIYYSDFYFEKMNLIIEIKSLKWYEEHLEKNIQKQKSCIEQGFNFIFIIDKDYTIFNKIIKHLTYDKKHSWQYDIRLKSNDDEKYGNLKISDFTFEYVNDSNKNDCNDVKEFIEKYEWLGKMPNRPTHRFIAKYKGELGGVVVMATPNAFSKLIDNSYDNLEKLISRGASAPWTPKNLASSLIMWAINWMVKNTQFRVFTAYSDTEAKELGTIYQACNFIYLGQKYGGEYLYFDLNKPHLWWFSNRNFRRKSIYNRVAKKLNITKTWDKVSEIPIDIKSILDKKILEYKNNCIERKTKPKHKYVYILGKDKRETKMLLNKFKEKNPKLVDLEYPKTR